MCTPAQRRLQASAAAYAAWAKTTDRTERTAAARAGFMRRFELEVDPTGELDPVERARRAEYAKKSYFRKLALKSSRARTKN
jgi:hypothetical protein